MVYTKIECPSLSKYLDLKDQEETNTSEVNNTCPKKIEIKSHSQPPVLRPPRVHINNKPSPLNAKNTIKGGTRSKANIDIFGKPKIKNLYTSDKIVHENVSNKYTTSPNNKAEIQIIQPDGNLDSRNRHQEAEILKSLDTNQILKQFQEQKLEDSDSDSSDGSDEGDTTSGSDSNFDDKELAKVLPFVRKKKKKKLRKPKTKKQLSTRSQRPGSKDRQNGKKLATIQKAVSRSESYRRMHSATEGKSIGPSSAYLSNLCKSSNNLQDKNSKLNETSLNIQENTYVPIVRE